MIDIGRSEKPVTRQIANGQDETQQDQRVPSEGEGKPVNQWRKRRENHRRPDDHCRQKNDGDRQSDQHVAQDATLLVIECHDHILARPAGIGRPYREAIDRQAGRKAGRH